MRISPYIILRASLALAAPASLGPRIGQAVPQECPQAARPRGLWPRLLLPRSLWRLGLRQCAKAKGRKTSRWGSGDPAAEAPGPLELSPALRRSQGKAQGRSGQLPYLRPSLRALVMGCPFTVIAVELVMPQLSHGLPRARRKNRWSRYDPKPSPACVRLLSGASM